MIQKNVKLFKHWKHFSIVERSSELTPLQIARHIFYNISKFFVV